MSGNCLTGSLEEIFNILTDISLSHNILMERCLFHFNNMVDSLSYNKLTGRLDKSFVAPDSSALELIVNRFSGKIPKSLFSLNETNILKGNLFQCEADNFHLQDQSSNTYVCGSNSLNIAMITGSICFGFVVIFGISIAMSSSMFSTIQSDVPTCWEHWRENFRIFSLRITTWNSFDSMKSFPRTQLFFETLSRFVKISVIFSGCYILICVPCYVLLKSSLIKSFEPNYSVYFDDFGWKLTSAFIHGVEPLVVLFSFITPSFFFFHEEL